MEIIVRRYQDGLTVETKEGEKIYVSKKMFAKEAKYRQERNAVAFAIGEIILDRSYNNKEINISYEDEDTTYENSLLAH